MIFFFFEFVVHSKIEMFLKKFVYYLARFEPKTARSKFIQVFAIFYESFKKVSVLDVLVICVIMSLKTSKNLWYLPDFREKRHVYTKLLQFQYQVAELEIVVFITHAPKVYYYARIIEQKSEILTQFRILCITSLQTVNVFQKQNEKNFFLQFLLRKQLTCLFWQKIHIFFKLCQFYEFWKKMSKLDNNSPSFAQKVILT